MQIKLRTWILPALALLVVFSSCSKSNKQGKWVPKDAMMAFQINGKSLNEKLPWDEIKKNVLFEQAYADSALPPVIKNLLDNPENSGIDIRNDLVIFAQQDSIGGIVVVQGSLKDPAKFKQFNSDMTKGAAVTEKDGISYVTKAPMAAGWNKENFVYVMDAPQLKNKRRYIAPDDSTAMDTYTAPHDLVAACKGIFDLKQGNSLSKDDRFTTLMNTDADVRFWLNMDEVYKNTEGTEALRMLNMNKLYEGNVLTATAGFEAGKIKVSYSTYVGKEMKKIARKFSGGKVDEEMLKRLPSKDVAAVMAMHFKPEGIKELISMTGMESMVNIGLVFLGFSLDDFVKANKGDILISLNSMKPPTPVLSDTANGKPAEIRGFGPTPDFLFATSIGDKDAFNQLIHAGKKMSKEGNVNDNEKMAYNTNDKYFAIGSSKETVDQYLGKSNTDHDFISHISGEPFGGYVNIQYILKSFSVNEIDSTEKALYEASLKMWDNLYMKGGDFKDGRFTYDMEVNLMDKSTNSLKQLNQYLGLLGKQMLEQRKKDADNDKVMEEMIKERMSKLPPPPVKGKKNK